MPAIINAGAVGGDKCAVMWQAMPITVSASSSAATFPAINASDPATYNSWRPSANNASLVYDFGLAVAVDSIGVAAHNMASSGSTMTFSSSETGEAGSWVVRCTYSAVTDEDVFIAITQDSFRYWRITLSVPANIGVMMIGKRLIFPYPPVTDYTPLHHARKYTKMFNDSIRGQFLGNRVMSAGAETDVDIGFVDFSFSEGELRPFESHYNQGGTFFYAGCPDKTALDVGYCRAADDDESIAVTYIEAGILANVSFGIRAYQGWV